MAHTYLQVVNEILVDSNEVQLTDASFANAVGIQLAAKNYINRAYLEICGQEVEWPFLAAADSNTNEPYAGNVSVDTVLGTRWYKLKTGSTSVSSDYGKVDWDSFYLTTEGVAGETAPYEQVNLSYIPFDEWKQRYSEQENTDSSETQDYGIPKRVIHSLDGRFFGLSPIPDKVYKVYFTAWVKATKLSASTDTVLIPDEYVPVLVNRANYYLQMFKKDYQEATLSDRAYRVGLSQMRRALMGRQSDYMRDDRVIY